MRSRASLPDQVRLLLRLFRFRPGLVWAYLATDVLWNYAMLLLPGLLLRAVLDALTGGATARAGVWALVAILGGVQVSSFVAGGLGGWWSHQRAQQTYATLIRANLLARLLRRPAAAALPFAPAQALARFDRDVDQVSAQVVVWETLAEAAVLLVALVVLALLAAWVAALVLAPVIVIAVGVSWAGSRLRRFREALQESIAEITRFLGGVFGALAVVRAAGAEPACVDRFRHLAETRHRATLRDTLLAQLLRSLSTQTYGLAVGAVLLLLAVRVRGGTMSTGDLALVVTYAGSVATAGSWMGGDLAAWRQAAVSLRRLAELLPGTPVLALAEPRPVLRGPLRAVPAPPAMAPLRVFEAHGLTCSLGGRTVVSGVDLTLRPGELVVVTGRVGAGKSTLVRALLGLLPATGDLRWNGELVGDPASFLVPPRCGYLPQAPTLLSGSLRENVLLGRPETDGALAEALAGAALDRDLATFPDGLDTLIGRRGLRLSGGQVQRLALARVLVQRPAVAVLDDLSSALDPATEALVLGRLRRRGGPSCLAVSNHRSVLAAADRIVVLRGGRVDAAGALPALLRTSPELRAIWKGADGPEAP